MLTTLGLMAIMAALASCDCLLEDKLIDKLLGGYNINVIPTTEDEPVVTVKHGMNAIKIVKFDHKVLTLETWNFMEWHDASLTWDPDHYHNVTSTEILHKQIWTPDIVEYSYNEHYQPHYEDLRVSVSYTGKVTYVPVSISDLACEVSKSGEEIYTCQVKLGSWVYSGSKLNLKNQNEVVQLNDFVEDPDWAITNSTVVRNVAKYSCCSESYPNLVYTVELRPKHHRHHCG
ncbi:neuronal acetylcholine receptor subunit alpha-2-like [Argopecten irradians]|uniref:neuronal acetylcholine receptor subunit alpha-2-like n=1 Tax=Argopecten irradians TaxID=31199 RepID=UPI00371D5883